MSRPIRVEFGGAVHHVTARGNERQNVFLDDEDRQEWLSAVEEMSAAYRVMIHCYCRIGNHYHLVLETPLGNLSEAMGSLQTTFTVRYNRRRKRSGHLFQGRFKAQLVEADGYAMELLRYVHLNPVRIGVEKGKAIPAEGKVEVEQPPCVFRTGERSVLAFDRLAWVFRSEPAGGSQGLSEVCRIGVFRRD